MGVLPVFVEDIFVCSAVGAELQLWKTPETKLRDEERNCEFCERNVASDRTSRVTRTVREWRDGNS